jgi:hypothetical protein
MRYPFRTYTFHMWKGYVLNPPKSDRESVLMTRCEVQIRPKLRWHNPDVLRCTISGVQPKNSGVMLLKFHPGLNPMFHHKHALSVTIRWVYDISFPIDLRPRCEVKNKITCRLLLVCSLRNG